MENIINLIRSFTFSDGIDIFIVSIILYRFFMIIQGTRAVQVLVGTAVIATLYWMSLTFNFYALNWLLQNFFDYFFVMLIILFQDQIQTALAMVGEFRFLGKKKKNFYDGQIEEVVSACSALAREKTGALIVFERLHGLLNYASTGTRLDSRIHSDVIYALFQTASPLHDGAIILYQNKIQAAGCFLPLSKNIDLDRRYGTRHRAAMGVSEVSDAIVVIVSEETGRISICNNGIFHDCANEYELRRRLRATLYANVIDTRPVLRKGQV